MKNLSGTQQILKRAVLLSLHWLAVFSAHGQTVPLPRLANCPNPGMGIKDFPATISAGGQPVTIYANANNNAYNLSPRPGPGPAPCGISIRPGTLLLPGPQGQGGGAITYTFSKPVSNVQIALEGQGLPGINQLTVTAANGATPVTVTLTVFNSSPDSCTTSYLATENVVQAGTPGKGPAAMVNIGGAYFTTLALHNTSANNSRSWVDLRLCNLAADCLPPEKPALGAVVQPASPGEKGSFNILNYKASYTYFITPSEGVARNKWKITAPANQSYTVTAVAGSCKSAESAPVTLIARPVNSASSNRP